MKSKTLMMLSEELLENQKIINQLQQENAEIKSILVKYTNVGQTIELDDGNIECRQHKPARSFSRNNVLDYITRNYGNNLAKEIDKKCTRIGPSEKTLYIKLKK